MPEWFSNAREIVYSSGSGSSIYLYTMNADGSNQTQIPIGTYLYGDSQPDWEPDPCAFIPAGMMGVASECQGEPDTCEITLGVGDGDGNPVNLYINISSQPNETMDVSGLAKILHTDGTGYTGFDEQVDITVTGEYRVRPDGQNDRYWYRAQFTLSIPGSTVGWITQTDMAYALENATTKSFATLNNLPVGLPEQDRSGAVVHTLLYDTTKATIRMLYAPIRGNISLSQLQGRNDRILRIHSYADNPTTLGGGTFLLGVMRYSETNVSQGWVLEDGINITASDVQNVRSTLGPTEDKTALFGQPFQNAVSQGVLPGWPVQATVPILERYPVSTASTCAVSQNYISGLGEPFDSFYGVPGYHIGVDFYAPDNSSVFSIAGNGLVVGIGVGQSELVNPGTPDEYLGIEPITGVLSAYDWGSAGIEAGERGYSVIVRHRHLYVLYGHLRTLDPGIFVGALVNEGTRLGTIGRYNDPHVHIEIRNFGTETSNEIPAEALQPNPMRQYGFVAFATTGQFRPNNHYDSVQFYDQSVNAYSDDTAQSSAAVSGLGLNLGGGGTVTLSSCNKQYLTNSTLPLVFDSVLDGDIRGFVLLQPATTVPVPPSSVPVQP